MDDYCQNSLTSSTGIVQLLTLNPKSSAGLRHAQHGVHDQPEWYALLATITAVPVTMAVVASALMLSVD